MMAYLTRADQKYLEHLGKIKLDNSIKYLEMFQWWSISENVLNQLNSLIFGLEKGERNAVNLSWLLNPSRLLISYILDFDPPYKLPFGELFKY